MYLEKDFCDSARGYFSRIRNYDGSLIDKEIFAFKTGFADDLTPIANLTIHATER